MKCLKCGVEYPSEQVFCDECLADMARHPVKPGTPVIIPRQSKPLPSKRAHIKLFKPEIQIAGLRKLVGWLIAIIIILLIGVALLTMAMLHYKDQAQQAAEQHKTVAIVSRETFFDSI